MHDDHVRTVLASAARQMSWPLPCQTLGHPTDTAHMTHQLLYSIPQFTIPHHQPHVIPHFSTFQIPYSLIFQTEQLLTFCLNSTPTLILHTPHGRPHSSPLRSAFSTAVSLHSNTNIHIFLNLKLQTTSILLATLHATFPPQLHTRTPEVSSLYNFTPEHPKCT